MSVFYRISASIAALVFAAMAGALTVPGFDIFDIAQAVFAIASIGFVVSAIQAAIEPRERR